jgi:hypothetical protein
LSGFFLKQHEKEEMDVISMPKWSKLMVHTGWAPAGRSVSAFTCFHGIEAFLGPADAFT